MHCINHRIDIKVGYSCNNRCFFCVQGHRRLRLRDRTTEEVLSILKKRRPDSNEVVFTGGEATIRKDFFALARYARKLQYTLIQVQSNGRMFAYEDFCKKAIDAGVNSFALALHGSRSDIHDSLTRVPGSFSQTISGIRNLKKLKQKVLLNTVINAVNYKDLPNTARLVVGLGIDQFQFAFMHISEVLSKNHDLARKIVARKSEVKDYVKIGLQIGIDNDIPVMVEAMPYCFMEGYEQYISERLMTPTSVEEVVFIENFDRTRKEEAKIKGPHCISCRFYDICEGPWKEYPQLYGWDEFRPVNKHYERNRDKTRIFV